MAIPPISNSLPAVLAVLMASGLGAQTAAAHPQFEAFEVAAIKPTPPDWRGGRYIRMTGPQRFEATNYNLRVLIAAAYNLNPQAVIGGPNWIDSDSFDIQAATPGDTRPNFDQQLNMLRSLITDRFQLAYHREDQEMPVYALTALESGPKLKQTTASAGQDPEILNHIYPDKVVLKAANATLAQVAGVMQRSIFDRPVLDLTGLSGQYDFELEFTPDESLFDGRLRGVPESTAPGLFTAIREQLGLKLEATRGRVLALVIDGIERPAAN